MEKEMWFDLGPREDVKFKKENKNECHGIKKGRDVQTTHCVQITVSIPASTNQCSKPAFPKVLPGVLDLKGRTNNQMTKHVVTWDQLSGSESYPSTSGLCNLKWVTQLPL